MERPLRGDVVVVPFPFLDLSQSKRRPALVLATLQGDDLILCQITSERFADAHAVEIAAADFQSGSLKTTSHVRPGKVFTADRSLVLYRAGQLKTQKLATILDRLIAILRG